MRALFTLLFAAITFQVFSQDSLKRKPPVEIFHISTTASSFNPDSAVMLSQDTTKEVLTAYEAMDLNIDSSTLMVLSLVDTDGSIIRNWNKFIERYRNGNYLIVVENGDGTDKSNFMSYFYQQRSHGADVEKAYQLTSDHFKYISPELHHFLNIKK